MIRTAVRSSFNFKRWRPSILSQSRIFSQSSSNINRLAALSLSTWFCIPDQGMKDFEILSRASCFLIQSSSPFQMEMENPKFHVITVSHSVAPWRWPKLYSEDWLRYIDERHTYYTMEVRDQTGCVVSSYELFPRTFHHPSRDVAVLHLENEIALLEELNGFGVDLGLNLIDSKELALSSSSEFLVQGYEVLPGPGGEDPLQLSCSKAVGARFSHRSPYQSFLDTQSVLQLGMCGGPVLVPSALMETAPSPLNPLQAHTDGGSKSMRPASRKSRHGKEEDLDQKLEELLPASVDELYKKKISELMPRLNGLQVLGMVEGIVPTDYPDTSLQGKASFVESFDIQSFLQQVEDGHIEPLIGGEAIDYVIRDKDPSKVDLSLSFYEDMQKHESPATMNSPHVQIVKEILDLMSQHGFKSLEDVPGLDGVLEREDVRNLTDLDHLQDLKLRVEAAVSNLKNGVSEKDDHQ